MHEVMLCIAAVPDCSTGLTLACRSPDKIMRPAHCGQHVPVKDKTCLWQNCLA